VGDADDRVAERLQRDVAPAIVLEGRGREVELATVELDDEALFSPEEVDLVAVDPDVHLRLRKVGLSDGRREIRHVLADWQILVPPLGTQICQVAHLGL
jgi:hypothetical protein